jgi:hypothetical protein
MAASANEGGQTVSSLQAEVAQGASRIRAATVAFDQASLLATNLTEQVAADKVRLSQLESGFAATRRALQADAITSYMGGSATGLISSPTALSDPSVRAEYIDVAAGDLEDAVDQYATEEQVLNSAEQALLLQVQASQTAMAVARKDRSQALQQAQVVQSQLDAWQQQHLTLTADPAGNAGRPDSTEGATGLPVNDGVVKVVRQIVVTTPSTPPPTTTTSGYAPSGGVWRQLRECESGDNYAENTGNGFYGAYQFSQQTWSGLGFPGRPDLEPPAMQDQAARTLQARSGWGQWPACSAALGLT